MTFEVERVKFGQEDIPTTLGCLKCGEVFQKEFPLDLEGQVVRFKCPVCHTLGEADLPYKESSDEPVKLEEDLDGIESEESDAEQTESLA